MRLSPLASRYGVSVINQPLVEQALRRTSSVPFAGTPKNVCWMLTPLELRTVDGRFLQEWTETWAPRIIFMYRDPRDVTLSMVNFLSGKTAQGFGNFSENLAYSRILSTKQTLEDKLTYALSDPSFPCNGDHERCLWLLNHPDVCKVSFEQLVGAAGGGSDEAQEAAVGRVIGFSRASAGSERPDRQAVPAGRVHLLPRADRLLAGGVHARSGAADRQSAAGNDRSLRLLVRRPAPVIQMPEDQHREPIVVSDARLAACLEAGPPDIGTLWEFCMYFEFDRELTADGIAAWLGPPDGLRVLDCACGSGFPALELTRRGYDLTCTDGSEAILAHFRRNSRIEEADLDAEFVLWEDLPRRYGSTFDVVITPKPGPGSGICCGRCWMTLVRCGFCCWPGLWANGGTA